MSHKDGRVILSAWVDPALRDYARTEARAAGVTFSKFVERAVQQYVSALSSERATRDMITAGLHPSRRRVR